MPNSQLCCPKPPPNLPTICSFISFPFFLSTSPFFQCPRLQVVHHFPLMILRALSKIRLFHKSGWNSCKLMMMPLWSATHKVAVWPFCPNEDICYSEIWVMVAKSVSDRIKFDWNWLYYTSFLYQQRRLKQNNYVLWDIAMPAQKTCFDIFLTKKWLSVRKIWKKRSREICFFTLWPSDPSSARS